MNEKNLEYLKNTLEYLGFGSRLNQVLENAIRRDLLDFKLGINNVYTRPETKDQSIPVKDQLRFELNFHSKEGDMHYLNTYKVSLKRREENEPRERTFDLDRDHRITAYQAYKLLSGLSFEKEITPRPKEGEDPAVRKEKIPVWFKLNLDITDAFGKHPLRTFYPEYKFDLDATLDKYPLKGLDKPEKREAMLKSLRSGELVSATMSIAQKAVPVWLAANPQARALDVYDKNMVQIKETQIFPDKERGSTQVKSQANADAAAGAIQEEPWKQDINQTSERKVGR